VSDAALQSLGNVDVDPAYGARPLKRAIQKQLENPLAHKTLATEFTPGDTIVVEAEGSKLLFTRTTSQRRWAAMLLARLLLTPAVRAVDRGRKAAATRLSA